MTNMTAYPYPLAKAMTLVELAYDARYCFLTGQDEMFGMIAETVELIMAEFKLEKIIFDARLDMMALCG
jgi:hypothetical protein